MDTGFWIVAALAAVLLAWISLSPDPLARTIRVRITGVKAQAAKALDDAMARMEAAEADIRDNLEKAKSALVTIKAGRITLERRVNTAQAEVDKWQAAAETAARANKRNLVVGALAELAKAQKVVDALKPQLQLMRNKEEEVAGAVSTFTQQLSALGDQKAQIQSRYEAAQTSLDVQTMLAGVDFSGHQGDVERAFKIVEGLEDKAGAMAEVAGDAGAQSLEDQIKALSTTDDALNGQADALLARYGGASTNA